MKKLITLICIVVLLITFFSENARAGEPVCHVLVCCRGSNDGMKFLVNGKWNEAHDYRDINQVRDILQKIKDAGINTISVDFTNASQWTKFWNIFEPMIENIRTVCKEKNMQYFLFIGASLQKHQQDNLKVKSGIEFWNKRAKYILDNWAHEDVYRKYGHGDNRPILIVFQPADMYWEMYNRAVDTEKTSLSQFHIGTTQVNDPILPGKSDGWGYRNYSQSVDGKVRFVAPNGGVSPDDPWFRITVQEWERRIAWGSRAEHYSIYGSYDDTCDAIHWGIADTRDCTVGFKKYPDNKPYIYYNALKDFLNPKDQGQD